MTAPKFTRGEVNVYSSPTDLSRVCAALRGVNRKVVLVPTMGALHAGHRELIRRAKRIPNTVVAVSIFVNPLQFGPNEDLDRYPRALDDDLRACAEEGAEIVFTPDAVDMYPPDAVTTVQPGPLGEQLEGASRPGHFAGVLTVVAKLLNLTRPDYAMFGEKDYQQLILVRQMVKDLHLSTRIIGVPTVREDDGLALSSRNRYLSDQDRKLAVALPTALAAGMRAGPDGVAAVLAAATESLAATSEVELDYLELRASDLAEPPEFGEARLLIAARVGPVRLIDNTGVQLGDAWTPGSQDPTTS
ncbi:pantothenate synthetase [Tamaricihabitans halophyticus]|uniref:Pantothenate synthetase n=1 Tax=Tamaricihabitans halophyticus TaxID=1262583 RepID=A0A4R2R4A0_9PSEU|nr:pantoate--beta-alanine ligase [Tamaricihabitans halophyticus]TCP56724.1 pantothenate synthetase [Tamaricihabitans halophyticus]